MTTLVGRLVDSGRPVRIRLADSRIESIEEYPGAPEQWVAPGFIDIQVNGFAGHDVNTADVSADDIRALAQAEFAVGVTAFCPTIITGSTERIVHALKAVAAARAADPLLAHAIPCVHVEGPYIAAEDGPRGAHDKAFLRPPDIAEFRQWQEASGNLVGIITLAPELPGSADYIRAVTETGVVVSIGHSAATSADIEAAVAAGARLSTHLGNGSHAVLPRHPNYIWDQLAADDLSASFIADGHHLPPAVLTVMLRAKGIERSILVSDTVALAGQAPGRYRTPVGGDVELTDDGRLVLPGTAYLAGATRPLDQCLDRAARHPGVDLADAVRMASENPARLLGLTGRGAIRPGADADLTVFTRNSQGLEIITTVVNGQVVHG
ncbi:MAG TPA: N-acetylglucosamine-6-phosphate deacetylase [Mycobacteriales bacterium]|nr:N-acetylglucosamine-6-phosphate deacetylase [Mycobacteriales bacterium]